MSVPTPVHHPIFLNYHRWAGCVPAGFAADFLGILTRIDFFVTFAKEEQRLDRQEATDYPPFNEEYFEWLDLLHAVEEVRDSFTMIELGAGYGRWLVRAAKAMAATRRLPVQLIGVEAEAEHFAMMHTHFTDNGLDPVSAKLIHAAVTTHDESVKFLTGHSNEWFGQFIQPFEGYQPKGFADVKPAEVRAVSLNTLLEPLDRVDLVDMDIQGHELAVVTAGIDLMDRKVRRVHIETHTPQIEAQLRPLMLAHGWSNVYDFPVGTEQQTMFGRIRFEGGIQTWLNPRLA